jgi:hypothetical protein
LLLSQCGSGSSFLSECGSGSSFEKESGSGSSFVKECGFGSGSRSYVQKLLKKFKNKLNLKFMKKVTFNHLFPVQILITLLLILFMPNYDRYFGSVFSFILALLRPSGSGSSFGMQIRILWIQAAIEDGSGPGSETLVPISINWKMYQYRRSIEI